MKFSTLTKWCFTPIGCLAIIPISMNVEALTSRMGMDKILADAVYPLGGLSPIVQFFTHPLTLAASVLAFGTMIGMWLNVGMQAFDARRANTQWWRGRASFTIERASCLLVGVPPSHFVKSEIAQGLADELVSLVRAGNIPTYMEEPRFSEETMENADLDGVRIYCTKPNIGRDGVIAKSNVEKFAEKKGHILPWKKK